MDYDIADPAGADRPAADSIREMCQLIDRAYPQIRRLVLSEQGPPSSPLRHVNATF
jgi:hypothetical protein